MALWGNNDAVGTGGTVALNYSTRVVTGTGTTFGQTGAAQVGDVIRIGEVGGTYFGDATISLTIDSTMGLSGAGIAGTTFQISQLPKSSVLDVTFSENTSVATGERYVYGVSGAGVEAAEGSAYGVDHSGWVGVQTYVDAHGSLRVKKEVLVAMSGITTGNTPVYDASPLT